MTKHRTNRPKRRIVNAKHYDDAKAETKDKGTTQLVTKDETAVAEHAPAPDSFQSLLARVDSEMRDMERRVNDMFHGTIADWSRLGSLVHGWGLGIDQEGYPRLSRFGNLGHDLETITAGWRKPFLDARVDTTKGEVVVMAEIPGVDKADITAEIHDDYVAIRAEGKSRRYEGRISVGHRMDAHGANATYEDGMLTIKAPLAHDDDRRANIIRVD